MDHKVRCGLGVFHSFSLSITRVPLDHSLFMFDVLKRLMHDGSIFRGKFLGEWDCCEKCGVISDASKSWLFNFRRSKWMVKKGRKKKVFFTHIHTCIHHSWKRTPDLMEVHFVVTSFHFISMSLDFSCKWPWRLITPCFRHLLRLLILNHALIFIFTCY